MNTKKIAIMASMMMLMVAFAGVPALTIDASDAATDDSGIVDVYFKGPSGDLQSTTVTAYDLYQAINLADSALGFTAVSTESNSAWNQLMNPGQYQYYNPNENYGTLSNITIGETTYPIDSFTTYVYNKTTDLTSNYSWNLANPALGWYHPYADYSATYDVTVNGTTTTYSMASAAVAIVYGADSTALNGTSPKEPVTITESDAYKYTFTIKSNHSISFSPVSVKKVNGNGYVSATLNSLNIRAGMNIVGWGSNAFEALKDALGSSNVIGGTVYADYIHMDSYGYYQYYSWLDKVLNNGTQTITNSDGSTTYMYWSSSVGGVYCSYTLGYYSSISGAPNGGNAISLTYV